MLTYIKINGFKSFHQFEMEFTPFTLVAGANASGKSNLFDALKLLARLAETDLKTAFGEQRGNPAELFTQYEDGLIADKMEFVVELLVNRTVRDNWGGEADLNQPRLRYEVQIGRKFNPQIGVDALVVLHESLDKIRSDEDNWARGINVPPELWKVAKAGGSNKPFIETQEQPNGTVAIKIRQDGRRGGRATPANTISQTVLGSVNSTDFPHVFAAKEEMRAWKFLQLNPEDLRQPTRKEIGASDEMTSGGKYLAGALFRIKRTDPLSLQQISRTLNVFLPNFVGVDVLDDDANKQFVITLTGADGRSFSSSVLSEGTLRLLALSILQYDPQFTGLLCFEEPENGIHPFRVGAMAQLLYALSGNFDGAQPLRQVIVNTHSPLLLKEFSGIPRQPNVSLWFSQLTSRIITMGDKRCKFSATKILPVVAHYQPTMFVVSPAEQRFTLAEASNYLQTSDVEHSLVD